MLSEDLPVSDFPNIAYNHSNRQWPSQPLETEECVVQIPRCASLRHEGKHI